MSLAPPRQLEIGTILTLRMRGHSRTNGEDYYAPAVVLKQHRPNGEIEVMIWDSTAGTHYNAAYPIRDISSRGEGAGRELYEESNIGQVLFSPVRFAEAMDLVLDMQQEMLNLQIDVAGLKRWRAEIEARTTGQAGGEQPAGAIGSAGAAGATLHDAPGAPKAPTAKK
jgi:hypothetical protein